MQATQLELVRRIEIPVLDYATCSLVLTCVFTIIPSYRVRRTVNAVFPMFLNPGPSGSEKCDRVYSCGFGELRWSRFEANATDEENSVRG